MSGFIALCPLDVLALNLHTHSVVEQINQAGQVEQSIQQPVGETVSVRGVDPEAWKLAKVQAISEGRVLGEVITDAIREYCAANPASPK